MTRQEISKLCEELAVLAEGHPELLDMLKNVPMWSESNKMISALEAAGVDNWEGYTQAQEIYDTL